MFNKFIVFEFEDKTFTYFFVHDILKYIYIKMFDSHENLLDVYV